MDPIRSVFCNGTIILDANDFVWITMGAGVGYFVTGYLFLNSIYNLCKRRCFNTSEAIPAIQV